MTALKAAGISSALIGLPLLTTLAVAKAQANPKLYFHVKHDPQNGYNTINKIQQIYQYLRSVNHTGLNVGIELQITGDWATQQSYLQKCAGIPIMLNAITSDDRYILHVDEIERAATVCPVKVLRFHEILSYYRQDLPLDLIFDVLNCAKNVLKIPVFWNEWDINTYPILAQIIQGYEDTVIVSFGTNNAWLEPIQGYQYLQQFKRKGASIQGWYWYERHNRINGTELQMPPQLMVQFTQQAFQAGCEMIQYEPYNYFFNGTQPNENLSIVLGEKYA
jgi:hypothetical protein